MASLGLWHGGRSGGSGWSSPFFSPFSSDIDHCEAGSGGPGDVSAVAHANVDWLETNKAHIFRVELP
ncbi:17.8 kDa class I heat shock protein, partial [Striga hermonthica]